MQAVIHGFNHYYRVIDNHSQDNHYSEEHGIIQRKITGVENEKRAGKSKQDAYTGHECDAAAQEYPGDQHDQKKAEQRIGLHQRQCLPGTDGLVVCQEQLHAGYGLQPVTLFQVIVQPVNQFQYVCVGVLGYIQGHRRITAKGDERRPLLPGPDQLGDLSERHNPRCRDDREVLHDCRIRAGARQAYDPCAVGGFQVARGGIAKIGADSL